MAAIVVGELPRSFDPAVSEWGNPITFIRDYFVVKIPVYRNIAAIKGTIRTETSN